MKITKLLICLMLAMIMVIGALPAFATEEVTETTEATTEETVTEEVTDGATDTAVTELPATPELSTDETCSGANAKNGKHSYEAWECNDEAHWRRCKHCEKYFGGNHDGQEQYKSDSTLHWHYCNGCKKKYTVAEHSFGEPNADYQKTCSVCSRVEDMPHEHKFEDAWSSNAFYHWHACTATFGLKGSSFCKFDAAHDYTLDGEHTFDENGYCAVCKKTYENVSGLAEHTYGEDGLCTVCGAEDVLPVDRPEDAGILWTVVIVVGVAGILATAAVFLFYKKK